MAKAANITPVYWFSKSIVCMFANILRVASQTEGQEVFPRCKIIHFVPERSQAGDWLTGFVKKIQAWQKHLHIPQFENPDLLLFGWQDLCFQTCNQKNSTISAVSVWNKTWLFFFFLNQVHADCRRSSLSFLTLKMLVYFVCWINQSYFICQRS